MIVRTLLVALVVSWSACPGGAIFAEETKVGAASVVITPKVGTPMAGYYFERKSEGIRDDLFAKAVVLERDGVRAALVSLDLISTSRGMVEDARAEIERITKVPGLNVMISATHAHTGPILTGRGSRDAEFGGKNPLTQEWNAELPKRIAQTVKEAEARLVDAKILAARGAETGIAFNRRFHMKDGTVGWNPGKLNPKIHKPAGPIDPDVDIVYAEAAKDRAPLMTYVNHPVHLDNVGGAFFSADMPGTISRLMGQVKGAGMVTCYTSGCCGDINHINVKWAEPQGGPANAERMGIILTGSILKAWPDLKPVAPGPLKAKSVTVNLPLAPFSAEDLPKAKAIVEQHRANQTKNPPNFLDAVWAYRVLDSEARHGEPIPVEVQVIALGTDVAWVSLPGEIFVEIGLAIKQDSPFPQTTIAELANGAIGYIPTLRAYTQGNYEVVSARCAAGSGEMLVDAAIKLLKELYAENSAAVAKK